MIRSADARKRPKRGNRSLYGLEYHGVAGSSQDCQEAVMRMLQCGMPIAHVRIITSGNRHCLFLTNATSDYIAVKSGFTSGYVGSGPVCFSITLACLHAHRVEIDECVADEPLIDRLDHSALTTVDVENITTTSAVRPSRWFGYILEKHDEQARNGTLWQEFPLVIPFSIIDSRIMDLARDFWDNPDSNLLRGYRRLEDLVREKTGTTESSTRLFSRAFAGKDAALTWTVIDEAERSGRASLFTGIYMAYRNPRAHQESSEVHAELLMEFLLLNHLYRLEREAKKLNRIPQPLGQTRWNPPR